MEGLQNQQCSLWKCQSSQYEGHVDDETATMVWPCLPYAWYTNPKGNLLWGAISKGTRQKGSKKTLEKLTEGPVNSGWYQLRKLGTACREPCSKAINNKKSSARFWDLETRGSRGSRREEETTKGSTRARIQQDLPSWAPRCPRIWLSRMGLISHLRACPPPLAGPLHNWSSETKKCHHHHYRV